MPRESASDKAARIIAARRIRLDREASSASRAVFAVVGDSDPLHPYTVTIERDGMLVRSCTCEGGQHHPIASRCAHCKAAEFVLAAIDSRLLKGA